MVLEVPDGPQPDTFTPAKACGERRARRRPAITRFASQNHAADRGDIRTTRRLSFYVASVGISATAP
jgi:hypothetical protein